jgi:hypothetical protein
LTRVVVALALLCVAFAPAAARACAGCSNPNLQGARALDAGAGRGRLDLGAGLVATTMRVVHAEACPEIGPICAARDEPPQLHDQRFYSAELRLFGALGLTESLGVEVQVPLRLLSTDITFRRLDGQAFTPDYENIHHRDETLVGLGDPWVLARGATRLGAARLEARGGIGLPLGDTQPNPFERARRGLSHQHIQFGAGSGSGVLALDARQPAGPVDVTASGQAVLFFAESRFGYQPGDRVSGGVAVGGRPTPRLRLEGGVDTLIEQPERWDGAIEEEGNLGRWELLVGGRVAYAFDALTLALSIKAPVYVHLTEAGDHDHGGSAGQLEYPAVVALTIARGLQVL